MAESHSTVLPVEVGLQYRRVFCTMVAAFTALTNLVEAKNDVKANQASILVMADALDILLSNLEAQLDDLGVPRNWRLH